MPIASNIAEAHIPADKGPSLQAPLTAALIGLAVSVPATGNVLSEVILTNGYKSLAVGVTSSQAGAVIVQRYLDQAGLVPQGPAIQVALSAGVAAVLNNNDGAPFQSMTVEVTNTAAVAANLTNLLVLLQAD